MTGHSGAACFTLSQYGAPKPPPAAAGNAAPVDSSQTPTALTANGWRCKNPACEEFNSDEKGKSCNHCKKPRDKEDIQKAADAIPLCKQKGTEVAERLQAATDAIASYPLSLEEQEILKQRDALTTCIAAMESAGENAAAQKEKLKKMPLSDAAKKTIQDVAALSTKSDKWVFN